MTTHDLIRHYEYQRRWRDADPALRSEVRDARQHRMVRTPAAQALATARWRIECRDALAASQPDVARDYDSTDS